MLEVLQMFLFLFKSKYRRKFNLCLYFTCSALIVLGTSSFANGKCTDPFCSGNGVCKNETCVCFDGWQGPECQYCGGKVRLSEPHGTIYDGLSNYTVGLKCSWLIDAPNATITLHLEEFATECGWDHLYIFDGDSIDSPLLAVFSGVMYMDNYKIRRIPQVTATSGAALVHFFSDDAYNMSGFNVTYTLNSCPSEISGTNCSGNGACLDGVCTCDGRWSGIACNIEHCPNNCGEKEGKGHCELEGCVCNEGYKGDDCGQLAVNGYWESIVANSFVPPGSASHGVAVWGDSMYIVAGERFTTAEMVYVYDFNGNVWETLQLKEGPLPRYAHSMVLHGDKLFLYGGVVGHHGPSSELWAFDINAKTWENISVKAESCNFTKCGPLEIAGHTATLVSNPNYKRADRMVVIFGHSPQLGYLNVVQEYYFGTREWRMVNTSGYPIKGGYGHTSSWDPLTAKIYVYGGLISESESTQVLSRNLYSYDPETHIWTLLADAPSARFLHTATFVSPGLMLVFGGNTHNETSRSFGAKCYSSELLAFDVLCDTWHILNVSRSLRADLARYGHSAVVFEGSLYIYGGFDGQMLSDIIKYTPGTCSHLTTQSSCLNTRPGVKCVWGSKCMKVTELPRGSWQELDEESRCPALNRSQKTQSILHNNEKCEKFEDCFSCVQTTSKCVWCGGKNCTYHDNCREEVKISHLEQCSDEMRPTCKQLHTCSSCALEPSCRWRYESAKCVHVSNTTSEMIEPVPCPTVCSSYSLCTNCTQEECIWCQNEGRCVDKNAYTASFPYGQCREWTTFHTKCRLTENQTSECSFYLTCAQCQADPACGWCDDGSNTGLGKCLPGGNTGPLSSASAKCPQQHWYFTKCPPCQCNGHSHCRNGTCIQCKNLTTGPNCEKCIMGYWGSPVNGGVCNPCHCNGQAKQCHPETGKCYCTTKGLTGDHCDKCDATNHYHPDPTKSGSCYYDLTIDYQFTFNLSKKEDKHFTQINFRNIPTKPDVDADFSITCSVLAKMNITVKTLNAKDEKPLFTGHNCSTFKTRFSKSDYNFNNETTFYVYVYDFQPPVWIQISFSQYPKLNLQQFFITFSTCFLLLLLIAAVMWKIKQRYDMYRRRQRLFVEMEQMASRPFAQVLVELEVKDSPDYEPIPVLSDIKLKRRDAPSPIALEPILGNKAAVLSLLVRLPTGGEPYNTKGQPAGIAIATALVALGNTRKPSIEQIKTEIKGGKTRKSQSQHPDGCI